MFSVRGDGMTTISLFSGVAEAALRVTASHGSFDGVALSVQAIAPSSSKFYLLKAIADSGGHVALDTFSIRGDGQTLVRVDQVGTEAVIIEATHPLYSGTVITARSIRSSSDSFVLFEVCLLLYKVLNFSHCVNQFS